ncbi:hypothetical protein RCTIPTONUS_46 [Rhodobacter phage RcTiptonus]|nr:hypothetical protein RCTIPTONUS_46 [Rhodobacter phage RcTiptonus]
MVEKRVYLFGVEACGEVLPLTTKVFSLGVEAIGGYTNQRVYMFGGEALVRCDYDPRNGLAYVSETMPNSEEPMAVYRDLVFPECIAYGTTGVPIYKTEKVEVASGSELRQSRWRYPKHQYDVDMSTLDAEQTAEVLRLWHVCSGEGVGFMFMDPQDNTSQDTEDGISGSTPTMLDQLVAVASAGRYEYPLYKNYEVNGHVKQRRIRYPIDGTILVAVEGRNYPRWSFNYDAGVLRLSTPFGPLIRSCTYDAETKTFTCVAPNAFISFLVDDLIYVSGFVNSAFNIEPGDNPLRVVEATEHTLRIEQMQAGEEFHAPSVTITAPFTFQSALPPAGAAITAGFMFHVPVRFATEDAAQTQIIAGLRETSMTDFTSLSLIEVID